MMYFRTSTWRILLVSALLLKVQPLHAEYLKIELRVYGLDCGLCAHGVAASVQRLNGVKSVDVGLKTGTLEIELVRGNTFRMSDLRKRIRENGFRSMEATATAIGQFNKVSKFEVIGSGESYDIGAESDSAKVSGLIERTFQVK